VTVQGRWVTASPRARLARLVRCQLSPDQAGGRGKHRWPFPKKIIPPNGRWLFAAREVGQAVITLAEDGNLAGPMRRSHPWGLPSGSGTLALLPR
jgi:hypothetical protein